MSTRGLWLVVSAILTVAIGPIQSAGASPSDVQVAIDRATAHLRRGACAETWNELWPHARQGDGKAIATLASAIWTHKLVPPALSQDVFSWLRHATILHLHALPHAGPQHDERLSRILDIAWFSQGKEVKACIDRGGALAACNDRFVPDLIDYARSIDAISRPAVCRVFGELAPWHEPPATQPDPKQTGVGGPSTERSWRELVDSDGDCTRKWSLAWAAAKNGDLEARWAAGVLVAHNLFSAQIRHQVEARDRVSTITNVSILWIHGIPGIDEFERKLRRYPLSQPLLIDLGGAHLESCLDRGESPPLCLRRAVQVGLIPSFDDFAQEIDRIIATAGPSAEHCRP